VDAVWQRGVESCLLLNRLMRAVVGQCHDSGWIEWTESIFSARTLDPLRLGRTPHPVAGA
jgi:hypothetical protein